MRCPRCTQHGYCRCTARQLEAWAQTEHTPLRALELVRDLLLARWRRRGQPKEEPPQGRLFGER